MKNRFSIYLVFWVLFLLSLPALTHGQALTMGVGSLTFGKPTGGGGDTTLNVRRSHMYHDIVTCVPGSGICGMQSGTSASQGFVQCSFVSMNYGGYLLLIIGFNYANAVHNANFPAMQNGGLYNMNNFTFPPSNTSGIPASSMAVGSAVFYYNQTNGYATLTCLMDPPPPTTNMRAHYKHKAVHKASHKGRAHHKTTHH